MFKNITILLDRPICTCEKEDLTWRIETDDYGAYLIIWCRTCGTQLEIPPEKFAADFDLEVPYPGGRQPRTKRDSVEKDSVKKRSSGKVVQLFGDRKSS